MTNTYPPSDPTDGSPIFTDTSNSLRDVRPADAPDTGLPETTFAGASHSTDGVSTGASRTDGSSGDSGKADAAKQAASDVGHGAKEATQQVAGSVKEEAGKVASEAKSQAKDLFHQSRGELTDQAATQQKRVAQGLRSVGDELQGMSSNTDSGGLATELVGQAASRLQGVAGWLDDRDPGSLLSEVKGFAARRPGLFIGIAAAAGLVAGRLTTSLISEAKDHKADTTATPTTTPTTPAPAVRTPAQSTTVPVVIDDEPTVEIDTFPGGLR